MRGSAVDPRRRGLLRGRVGEDHLPIRPPWSLAEAEFTRVCERCDACIEACEPGILVRGDGGFPELDFRLGACTFCAGCIEVCRPHALISQHRDPDSALNLSVRIEASCPSLHGITCRICGDRCPSGAIRFRPQTGGRAIPEILASACNGCGACRFACPANAVVILNSTHEVAA